MPLEFLKRKSGESQPEPVATPIPEEVPAQDYLLKLYYAGKSSEGVRIKAGPRALDELPSMLVGLAKSEIEVVQPLPIEFSQATPTIVRPSEAMQWLNAHHVHSPITRHALVVLESIDAIDLAFDTFVGSLLDGEIDTSGYPEYSAIVGGVASHWDEATGDMIVRAVVGWGGKGVRGDTDRLGARILAGLLRTCSPTSTPWASPRSSDPSRRPVAAAWSAPTAASPRPTSERSTARSAACACSAADAGAPTHRGPSRVPTYDYVCAPAGIAWRSSTGSTATGPRPARSVADRCARRSSCRRSTSRVPAGPRRTAARPPRRRPPPGRRRRTGGRHVERHVRGLLERSRRSSDQDRVAAKGGATGAGEGGSKDTATRSKSKTSPGGDD